MSTEGRATAVADMLIQGLTVAQMAERLGISPITLHSWARYHHLQLPRQRLPKGQRRGDIPVDPNRAMCVVCGVRRCMWSRGAGRPVSHGMCQGCRAIDLGNCCNHPGCTEGATHGQRCSTHRMQKSPEASQVIHTVTAFTLWDPPPRLHAREGDKTVRSSTGAWLLVPHNAEATHHADCRGCEWHEQTVTIEDARARAQLHLVDTEASS